LNDKILISENEYAARAMKLSEDKKTITMHSQLLHTKERCYQRKVNCKGTVLYQSSRGPHSKIFFSGNVFKSGKELILKKDGYIEYSLNDREDLSLKVTTVKEVDCKDPMSYSVNEIMKKYYFTLCDI
jgi:hypothetical protein